mmetsp:Transcript_33008/g.78821  ORF Transcript_33008/g.78821 Transcript_33008/m.78821 type:complete len:99 (-) Transcript_33008:593-889(-)
MSVRKLESVCDPTPCLGDSSSQGGYETSFIDQKLGSLFFDWYTGPKCLPKVFGSTFRAVHIAFLNTPATSNIVSTYAIIAGLKEGIISSGHGFDALKR